MGGTIRAQSERFRRRVLRHLAHYFRPKQPAAPPTPNERCLAAGRLPWAEGYWEYRQGYIAQALQDDQLMATFGTRGALPAGYGYRLDERVVEYPWLLTRLHARADRLLDAGTTLSYGFLLDSLPVGCRQLVVYGLTLDSEFVTQPYVSYVKGEVRRVAIQDQCMDAIVCISTIEHIGLDNQQVCGAGAGFQEQATGAYEGAMREFARVLAPGGRLYVTVPYGEYQNCGWLQQFDRAMVAKLVQSGGWEGQSEAYYRYWPEGWQVSTAAACAECRYQDIHAQQGYGPDYAAAARAVACLELSRLSPAASQPDHGLTTGAG
jgi:hypothetical protein